MRRRLALSLAIAAALAGPAAAASDQHVAPVYLYNSAGFNTHQQLSITSGAVVTLTVPVGATIAAFTVETASIRMLDDGTTPTNSLGNLWTTGPANYAGPLTAMKFIAVSTTATLDVLYYVTAN